jgi:hypothetical protein
MEVDNAAREDSDLTVEMRRGREIGRTMGRERWKVKEGGDGRRSWEGDGDGG